MTRPWSGIRETYAHFIEYARQRNPPNVKLLDGMLPLVEAIERSRYAAKVHGWCAHFDLCISPMPGTRRYERAYLRIAPLHALRGGGLRISYWPDPSDEAGRAALLALLPPGSLKESGEFLPGSLKKWGEILRAGIWGEEVERTEALVTLEKILERLEWIDAADRTR